MPKSIELTPRARNDWRGIWDHGVANWSARTAEAYYNRIGDRIEELATSRTIGLAVAVNPKLLKSLVGSHVVYFELTSSTLTVIRILHQRMDEADHLQHIT